MTRPKQSAASFRGRMIIHSTLIAAIGILGFGLLSLGFYQRELRRNLEIQLEELLVQTAPAILRLTGDGMTPLENRMAGRLLGRMEEFGAVYAVATRRGDWQWGPGWRAIGASLPQTNMRAWVLGKRPDDKPRERRRKEGRDSPPLPRVRDGLQILSSGDLPHGWIIAGVSGIDGDVLVGVPGTIHRPQMKQLFLVSAIAAPLSLGLVAFGAWVLSSRAIAPIRKLTKVAASTTAEDLSHRISGAGMEREFRELVDVFNGMMERLERSFGQARRFGQDAAHELNTPLTILTGKIDDAVTEAVDGSPEQLRLVEIADELSRLREIVRKLHLLARIDGGGLHLDQKPTDLTKMVVEVVEEMREAFPGIEFVAGASVPLKLTCDPALVRQVLLNLLSNAGSYNREGGQVDVEIFRSDGAAKIAVSNTGPAIPENFRNTIFDRFSRGDSSRTSGSGSAGLGLGLSISREFTRAQGGDLVLESGEEDRIRFVVTLPGSEES